MGIKATPEVHYPESLEAWHPVYSGDTIIARYYHKLNVLTIEVEYADKLPQILKAVGEEHGAGALNAIGGNIRWGSGPGPSHLERVEEPDVIKLSGRMIEIPLERPFPETYGDWVNLGMDIKEKAGIDDFKTTAEVNKHLSYIYEEEHDPAKAQEAKRWLAKTARELGIK